ncbi:MAG: methylated-DNA--[protein]-cysteine S-methyltransferase [Muribaculaceae bacterium]|nr:methylated-DNA--[protein]-cysteine S-methyltransferase [Muribaculaceae bacterium]
MMINLIRAAATESPAEVRFISPFGPMRMLATEKGISALEFIDRGATPSDLRGIPRPARRAIDLICGHPVSQEPINLLLNCSDFQFSVLAALLRIPRGQTATYSQVAAAIGHPSAVRAAASAIARNPIALLIPCHRVVPATGGTGNYRWGPDLKRALLRAEQFRTLPEHSAPESDS